MQRSPGIRLRHGSFSLLPFVVLGACSSPAPRSPPTAPIPAASTVCYAGHSTGMGQTARTIARRIVDPAAHQIVEDVSHDDAGAHGAKSFHVVMTVQGSTFAMTETSGAFSGTGTLTGDPWAWTAWTSTAQIPKAGITVQSDDELTPAGLKATKQITKDGKLLATTTEELKTFDCADWDKAQAALALPAFDHETCDRACRNFATLRYWQRADAEIAGLPAAEQAAARTRKQADFATQLAAGSEICATKCLAAKNPVQTACMAGAKTVDQLGVCDGLTD